jgi:hypothetical protein
MSTINADNLTVQNLTVSGTLAYSSVTAQTSGYPAGSIIEKLVGRCNGETVTVSSGTYTMPNVTSEYQLSSAWTDITGSELSYTPPAGTKRVLYEFHFIENADDGADAILSYKWLIDGTEVTSQYKAGGHYRVGDMKLPLIINCAADADNAATADFTSWTSAKTIKLQGYERSGSPGALHSSRYWEGGEIAQVYPPNLFITALA